ncbi:MAG: arabinose-5-phosphate isomerase [Oceanospirillaceae bacterium]|jgi:arabinose-5-phosphate isomerase
MYINIAKEVISLEIRALEEGKNNLLDSFADIVELIKTNTPPNRIVVMGMGKSGHVGRKIAATLASTGTPAFFVHPAEAGHGDLGMLAKGDIVIAISQSGNNEEILRTFPYIKRNGIRSICFTGNLNSPLAKYSDYVINTSVKQEACPLGLAPTASTTLTLALGDALAICLLKSRGFTQNDFAETHPHGALGRRLLMTIFDVMIKADVNMFVTTNLVIKDVLLKMTASGMGFVVIVNIESRPIGVFTDGDLRRCLDNEQDINETLIHQVMTKSFSLIHHDQLAVVAVDLMEQSKVSALPVVNNKDELIGLINMRQLLQAGVV